MNANQPADNAAELLAQLLDGLDPATIPSATLARLRQSLADPVEKDTHNMSAIEDLFRPRIPATASAAERAQILNADRHLRASVASMSSDALKRLIVSAARAGDDGQLRAVAFEGMARADGELVDAAHDALGAPDQEAWTDAWKEATGWSHEDPAVAEVRQALSETVEAKAAEASRAQQLADLELMRTGSGPVADVGVGDPALEDAARRAVQSYQGQGDAQ